MNSDTEDYIEIPYYRERWTAENQDQLYEKYFLPLISLQNIIMAAEKQQQTPNIENWLKPSGVVVPKFVKDLENDKHKDFIEGDISKDSVLPVDRCEVKDWLYSGPPTPVQRGTPGSNGYDVCATGCFLQFGGKYYYTPLHSEYGWKLGDGGATLSMVANKQEDVNMITIPANSSAIFTTGWALSDEYKEYDGDVSMELAARSSYAVKGLQVHPGIIDNDFDGEILVIVMNYFFNDVTIDLNKPVAQMVFRKIVKPQSTIATVKRVGGFGSTDDEGPSNSKKSCHNISELR